MTPSTGSKSLPRCPSSSWLSCVTTAHVSASHGLQTTCARSALLRKRVAGPTHLVLPDTYCVAVNTKVYFVAVRSRKSLLDAVSRFLRAKHARYMCECVSTSCGPPVEGFRVCTQYKLHVLLGGFWLEKRLVQPCTATGTLRMIVCTVHKQHAHRHEQRSLPV